MHSTDQLNTALAGRYAIERRIGEGGMATVYLARDVRHNRNVALKVLKPDLGAVVGVERFLSEIEVTANLQHPNLLPLFDSGAAEGLLFYVMPYVEGESLRARLEREKQLPVEEAVRIASAVASALDYAHRRGVIHRDLKPENILLHDGQPLVADFGIALAVSNAGGDRVTQTGLSLGTPRYMSPEQATGDRAIDARTDIYSLGAVTYEMLTGDPPHTGSSSQAIIARVLTERPRSIRSSRPAVPLQVEASVERALEKLAADRFESAREFADALTGKRVIQTTSSMAAAAPASRRGRTTLERALMSAMGVTLLALLTVVALLVRARAGTANVPEIRFDIDTPVSLGPLQISMSPDGQTILFGGLLDPNQGAIWSRRLSAAEATPIAATAGVQGYTFWSPDSRQFAYIQSGQLKRLPLVSSSPETVADVVGDVRGGSWNVDDVILLSIDGAIHRVSANGGDVTKLMIPFTDSISWQWPWFLPDGRRFLVLGRGRREASSGLFLASLDGDTPVRLMSTDTRAAFAPPDYVLFARDDALYAQQVDLKRVRLLGDPVRITDDVGVNVSNGSTGLGVSTTGALVTRSVTTSTIEGQLYWYSRSGARLSAVGDVGPIREIALSPDETRIAVSRPASMSSRRNTDVWVIDVASNISSRLVAKSNGLQGVLWSPDSRSVTYSVAGGEGDSVVSKLVGGSAESLVATSMSGQVTRAESYRPDGKSVLLREGRAIYVLDVGSATRATEVARFSSNVESLRISPDGRMVLYNTIESGTWQVWVASYPSFDNRRQVSAAGGIQPRWRDDGKELFYLTLDGKVMAASLIEGSVPAFRAPVELFQSPNQRPVFFLDQYDVSKDGQRFLFIVRGDNTVEVPGLKVMLNWPKVFRRE